MSRKKESLYFLPLPKNLEFLLWTIVIIVIILADVWLFKTVFPKFEDTVTYGWNSSRGNAAGSYKGAVMVLFDLIIFLVLYPLIRKTIRRFSSSKGR